MQRRDFLRTGTLAMTGGVVFPQASTAAVKSDSEPLRIALFGAGAQGQLLLSALSAMPNVHLQAICDIWEYARNFVARFCVAQGNREIVDHIYADYRDLLDQETSLDAVVIATPDFVHAEQATAALEAGIHVYCEPMMARTIDEARTMVEAMTRTGKLLQIGYHRRSDPRYWHVHRNLLHDANLPERLTAVQTQWAEPEADLRGFPRRFPVPDETLREHGYANMREFRNWRWFPRYSGGPYCDRVSHQLDICHWFLDAVPDAVVAMGGDRFYAEREAADTVMATYQFPGADGPLLVSCQMFTNTSGGGTRIYERFCGTSASLQIAENPSWIKICREPNAERWDQWIRKRYLESPTRRSAADPEADTADIQVSGEVEEYRLPMVAEEPAYQAHLANFLAAIQGEAELNCPADVAFAAQVMALKTLDAVRLRRIVTFDAADFLSSR